MSFTPIREVGSWEEIGDCPDTPAVDWCQVMISPQDPENPDAGWGVKCFKGIASAFTSDYADSNDPLLSEYNQSVSFLQQGQYTEVCRAGEESEDGRITLFSKYPLAAAFRQQNPSTPATPAILGNGRPLPPDAQAATDPAAATTPEGLFPLYDPIMNQQMDVLNLDLTMEQAQYLMDKFPDPNVGASSMQANGTPVFWFSVNNPGVMDMAIRRIREDISGNRLPQGVLPPAAQNLILALEDFKRSSMPTVIQRDGTTAGIEAQSDSTDVMIYITVAGTVVTIAGLFGINWYFERRRESRQAQQGGIGRGLNVLTERAAEAAMQLSRTGTFENPYIDKNSNVRSMIERMFVPQADQNNAAAIGASRSGKSAAVQNGMAQVMALSELSADAREIYYRKVTERMSQGEAAQYRQITEENIRLLKQSLEANGYKGLKILEVNNEALAAKGSTYINQPERILGEDVLRPATEWAEKGYKVVVFFDEGQTMSDGNPQQGRVAILDRIKIFSVSDRRISVILATTVSEYVETIATDQASANRYPPFFFETPSPTSITEALRLRPYVNAQYGVTEIDPAAMKAVFILGTRVNSTAFFTSAESYFLEVLRDAKNKGVTKLTLDLVFEHYDRTYSSKHGQRAQKGLTTEAEINSRFELDTREIEAENVRDRAVLDRVAREAARSPRVFPDWWNQPPTGATGGGGGTSRPPQTQPAGAARDMGYFFPYVGIPNNQCPVNPVEVPRPVAIPVMELAYAFASPQNGMPAGYSMRVADVPAEPVRTLSPAEGTRSGSAPRIVAGSEAPPTPYDGATAAWGGLLYGGMIWTANQQLQRFVPQNYQPYVLPPADMVAGYGLYRSIPGSTPAGFVNGLSGTYAAAPAAHIINNAFYEAVGIDTRTPGGSFFDSLLTGTELGLVFVYFGEAAAGPYGVAAAALTNTVYYIGSNPERAARDVRNVANTLNDGFNYVVENTLGPQAVQTFQAAAEHPCNPFVMARDAYENFSWLSEKAFGWIFE